MAKRSALNYETTRGILLTVGLALLAVVAAVMLVRSVDPIEVVATLMFLPIFLSFLYWGIRGGLLAAALAAVTYIALRIPAIQAVGFGPFAGLVVTRTVGYLGFAAAGGWASEQVKTNLLKLDLYDTIDDMSGLGNARALIDLVDLEKSRAERYEKIFSVATIKMTLPALPRRKTGTVLKQLATVMRAGARSVDYAAHGWDLEQDIFAMVLPETGKSGSETFRAKIKPLFVSALSDQGLEVNDLEVAIATYPDDPDGIETLLASFRSINRRQFPETVPAE